MARGKHRANAHGTARSQPDRYREFLGAVTGRLPDLELGLSPALPLVRSPSLEVEDHRLFNPDPYASPRSTRSRATRIVAKSGSGSRYARQSEQPYFASPRNVIICHRRKTRKEVLHAYGKTGKGSGKPRRRNQFSNVRC